MLYRHIPVRNLYQISKFPSARNSVYGLLEPNGTGKSTALKMITVMLQLTSGSILFQGHAWQREDLQEIGVLLEKAPLYDNLTARENLKVKTILLELPVSRIDEALRIQKEIPKS